VVFLQIFWWVRQNSWRCPKTLSRGKKALIARFFNSDTALKPPLTGMAYYLTTAPTYNHFCVLTSSHTRQTPPTFSRKGSQWFSQDISARYEALALKLPVTLSSFSSMEQTVYLFKP
jgi:hypothetical protein